MYGAILNEPLHDAPAPPGNDATEAERAADAEVRMGSNVVKTHEFVPSGGDGCQQCGFGPGALQHNTSQSEWKRITDPETFHEPPNYYNRGGYHCFDVMDALGLFTKYYIAAAFTYIWRCDFKGAAAEALRDLKKARRYLDWEIQRRETANERTSDPNQQPTSIQTPQKPRDAA